MDVSLAAALKTTTHLQTQECNIYLKFLTQISILTTPYTHCH